MLFGCCTNFLTCDKKEWYPHASYLTRRADLGHRRPSGPTICRCGSGKTTLAAQLTERFPQSITVHTDDFYLPPSRRVTGWESIPCANMDIQRLRNEVVAPARAGQAFSYQAYSCREGAYLPAHPLGPAPLVIVEGSYSHHPSLAPYYDIRIFVTCSPDEQARRLRKREGERYSNFVERWIPLEEGYFANYSIEENAEMMVVTD